MTYKVTITSGKDTVWFEASAPITEERTANYVGHDIVHLPTEIFAYKNTTARHFSITAKIVSRNKNEAKANSRYLDLLRSWLLPDFGASGATPPIVHLSAFYNTNIDKVPCVVKSYSFSYPEDVDWIYEGAVLNSGSGKNATVGSSAMPVIMSISVTLAEAYTPSQITARAWKMKLSRGGGFVLGGSADDVTSTGGGKQQLGEGTITPSIIDMASDSNFSGIATSQISHVTAVKKSVTSGNNSGVYGVSNSAAVKDSTPAADTKPVTAPVTTGILTIGISPTTQSTALSNFGRSAPPNQAPTFLQDAFIAASGG